MPHNEEDLFEKLEDAWQAVNRRHGTPIKGDEPSEALKDDWTYYENLIIHILRNKLQDHPALSSEMKANIADWIDARRNHGERDCLRRIRQGVEKGVRRPFRPVDMARYAYIVGHIDTAQKNNPTAKVTREYVRRKMIANEQLKQGFSSEAFRKLLNRLDAQDLFDD